MSLVLSFAVAVGLAPSLLVGGATPEQLAALAEAWPDAAPLPAEVSAAAPYPDLMGLVPPGGALLIVQLTPSADGLAVSGRVLAEGGYDRDLGTIHTTAEGTMLLTAVRQLWDSLAATTTAGTAPRLTADDISTRLTGLRGHGTAYPAPGDIRPLSGFSTPEVDVTDDRMAAVAAPRFSSADSAAERRAYTTAENDFITQAETDLHLPILLEAEGRGVALALIKTHLMIERLEHRVEDEATVIEVRLTPDGIRALTRFLVKEYGE